MLFKQVKVLTVCQSRSMDSLEGNIIFHPSVLHYFSCFPPFIVTSYSPPPVHKCKEDWGEYILTEWSSSKYLHQPPPHLPQAPAFFTNKKQEKQRKINQTVASRPKNNFDTIIQLHWVVAQTNPYLLWKSIFCYLSLSTVVCWSILINLIFFDLYY